MNRSSTRTGRGFTLVEVLVATALLASGMTIAFAAVIASAKSARLGELAAARTERMRAVSAFLDHRISGARPMDFGHDAASGLPLRFVGDARQMRFVADLPGYLGRGGPHLHRVQAVDTPHGVALRIDFGIVIGGEVFAERPDRPAEVLADGLQGARFSYRTLDEDGQPGEWRDRWASEERLPLQVRVEIVGRDGAAWPPLVVSLPLAGTLP